MHYQLFLPGRFRAEAENLVDVGLGGLLRAGDRPPRVVETIAAGPDGKPGSIIGWADDDGGFRPDRQTWSPSEPDPERRLQPGRFWLGLEGGFLPWPHELQRSPAACMAGSAVELADGRLWTVPQPMRHRLRLGVDGRTMSRREMRVWCVARWAMKAITRETADGTPIPLRDGAACCVDLLAVNYRLTLEICLLCGLLDRDSMRRVLVKAADSAELELNLN